MERLVEPLHEALGGCGRKSPIKPSKASVDLRHVADQKKHACA